MSDQGYFLLQGSESWRIGRLGADDSTLHLLDCRAECGAEELAQAVREFVRQHPAGDSSLVIGVASNAVLAGRISVTPEDQRSRRAMSYELESVLPLAAEEMVADFVCGEGEVFGVCLPIERWLPVVIELELAGLRVQSIVPAALLALQSWLTKPRVEPTAWIVWRDGAEDEETLDLFCLQEESLARWYHWQGDFAAMSRQLAVESLQHNGMSSCEFLNPGAEELPRVPGVEIRGDSTEPLAEHAMRTAAGILSGNVSPWVELRRDELAAGDPNRAYRGALRLLSAAACLFLLALATTFWIRGTQYRSRTEKLRQQQVNTFRQAFPQSRVPTAVLSRMRSEHAKLAAARSGKANVELPISALHVLHEFLSALPEKQRYRFRECRIEDGKIDLDVELRSHNDANLLVTALADQGFQVNAPTTVAQGQRTVSSRIFADVRSEDPR